MTQPPEPPRRAPGGPGRPAEARNTPPRPPADPGRAVPPSGRPPRRPAPQGPPPVHGRQAPRPVSPNAQAAPSLSAEPVIRRAADPNPPTRKHSRGRPPRPLQAPPGHGAALPPRRPVPPPPGLSAAPGADPSTAYAPGPPQNPPARAWSQDPDPRRTSPARREHTKPHDPGVAASPPVPGTYAPRQEPEPIPAADHRAAAPAAPPGTRPPRRTDDAAPSAAPGKATKPKKPRRKRRPLRWILVIVLVLLLTPIGLMFYYDSQLHRVDALQAYSGRPANTPGTTWLIVGTDSRADLSQDQKDKLATGDSDGARTDTIMLAHLPPSGKPMLISIPRDLYVAVPGLGNHKINAAYNDGGPQLLVRTVEELSGLRIDHYAEIGFGGFDRLVDAVGGVEMCLDRPLRDPKAGLRLKAGCQKLNGAQALGLVRTRAFPNADLERVVNQRKFMSALMSRALSPAVLLNPFRLFPFLNGVTAALTVGKNDHLWHLAWLGFKLRGDTVTTTVPTGGTVYTGDGDSLATDASTAEFFDYLRRGRPVPAELLSDDGGAVS
ncbi:LCP family glycopolymer transferase [Gordonia iterans]